jgi:hypothetical protein
MRQYLLMGACALALAAVTASGCASSPKRAVCVMDTAPPAPIAEATPAPRPGWIWRAGHWESRGGQWTWQPGDWQHERGPGFVWRDGFWTRYGNRYHWVDGHWERGATRVSSS